MAAPGIAIVAGNSCPNGVGVIGITYLTNGYGIVGYAGGEGGVGVVGMSGVDLYSVTKGQSAIRELFRVESDRGPRRRALDAHAEGLARPFPWAYLNSLGVPKRGNLILWPRPSNEAAATPLGLTPDADPDALSLVGLLPIPSDSRPRAFSANRLGTT